MQKSFLSLLLFVFLFLTACSGSKEKTMTSDQLKAKITSKISAPTSGEEVEIESIRQLNQGRCKYVMTQNRQVLFADESKVESNLEAKYELVNPNMNCQRLPSETKNEIGNIQVLKSQYLAKVESLTNEAKFVSQISVAKNATVQTLKEERYKNMAVASLVVQYMDTRDNQFYKYSAKISMESFLVGVFDIKITNSNNEMIDQTNLTHAKLNNPVVNYP